MSSRVKLAIVTVLTFGRFPLVLLFFGGAIAYAALPHSDHPSWLFAATFAALITSAVTDLFDGMLARRFRVETRLGAHADPLMDKFFYVATLPLLVFVAAQNQHVFHAVFLLVLTLFFLTRDQWVSFLRSIGSTYNVPGGANWSGKLRTGVNFPLICCIYHFEAAPRESQILAPWFMYSFEVLGLIVNVVSIVVYTRRYWPCLRASASTDTG
jgi:phosphatidylglycerophosphate synthase